MTHPIGGSFHLEPQASRLCTTLAYDSQDKTAPVTSHCPGLEGHRNAAVGGYG